MNLISFISIKNDLIVHTFDKQAGQEIIYVETIWYPSNAPFHFSTKETWEVSPFLSTYKSQKFKQLHFFIVLEIFGSYNNDKSKVLC